MRTVFPPLFQGKTLAIMPTLKCTAECTHCGTLSSPREKTWLPLSFMLSAIDQAAELQYKVVVFTGGEPVLAGRDLLTAISRAAFHGMVVRIVTNCYWAAEEAIAKRHVESFVKSGLKEIHFSTGDEHARFVPIDNVVRATRVSIEAGLKRIAIMVETFKERKITKQTLLDHPEWQKMRKHFPHVVPLIHETPWMPLDPRQVNNYAPGMTINRTNIGMRPGCTQVLMTTTLQANGSLGACCGLGMKLIPELQLGNIKETTIQEAEAKGADDFLKRWIRVEGPERILAWAATHDPTIAWEDMYAHQCQACLRLYSDPKVRQVISEHYQDKIADVAFGEWLLYYFKIK